MKFVSMKKVHEGKFLSRYDIVYETIDGGMKNYEMVSRAKDRTQFDQLHDHKPEAVIMIMHDPSGEKLLINREFRLAMGEFIYNFPAGLVDEGEDLDTSAARELREETGLTEESLEELRLRYITLRMKNGEIRQNYYFFAGLKPGAAVRGTCDEGRLEWVPYDSVLKREMPFTAKTVLRHYLRVGCRTRCIYGSVTEAEDSAFTELAEF